MGRPSEQAPARAAGRVAGVVALAALALFLGALTVGVLGAEIEGPPVLALLLRVFFGGVVGGLALFVTLVAVNTLRAPAAEPGMPPALSTFCPACGEATVETAAGCGRCEHVLLARDTRWKREERSGVLVLGLLMLLGLGLLSLGVFIGAGPLLEGERRVWKIASAAGLALLVGGCGLLFLWGAVSSLIAELFSATKWTYHFAREEQAVLSIADAEARFRKGALFSAHGSSESILSLLFERPAPGRGLQDLVVEQRAFVELVGSLFEVGVLAVWRARQVDWHWEHPSKAQPVRDIRDEVRVRALERLPPLELRPLFEKLAPHVRESRPIAELWREARDSAELRQLLATFPLRPEPPDEESPVVLAVAAEIRARLAN